jgi:hypothetical protein
VITGGWQKRILGFIDIITTINHIDIRCCGHFGEQAAGCSASCMLKMIPGSKTNKNLLVDFEQPKENCLWPMCMRCKPRLNGFRVKHRFVQLQVCLRRRRFIRCRIVETKFSQFTSVVMNEKFVAAEINDTRRIGFIISKRLCYS